MAEVKVFHDREGQTLTVWFTDPSLEYVSEEAGDEGVLMKNRAGRVREAELLGARNPTLYTWRWRPRPLERLDPAAVSKISPRLRWNAEDWRRLLRTMRSS